jgi:hypothetical protein
MPASGVSGLLQYKNYRLESAKGRRGLFRAFHLGPDFSQRGWELGDDLIGVRMAASSGSYSAARAISRIACRAPNQRE